MSLLPQRRDAQLRGAGRDKGSLPAYSYPRNEACRVALVKRVLNRLARYCTLPSISCNAGLSSALPLCNKADLALLRRCRCGRRGVFQPWASHLELGTALPHVNPLI